MRNPQILPGSFPGACAHEDGGSVGLCDYFSYRPCASCPGLPGVLRGWSSRSPGGVDTALTMEYRSGERTDRSVR
ncbi:unnamed protein product [Heligmosomoides polygyrus]|uniref:ShKT domain-containing protein n=1 Tax=Heligmosomoides polygyrus TaxID=6339 RepID=A0A183FQZ1_HELPZ|nr:unnamed protein product [Heligmosomoides polygyrus]